MENEISNKEWFIAENYAKNIKEKIQTHFMESAIASDSEYVKVAVLVPMTENINMEFKIDVPYKLMDEDNTALLEYFIKNIYKPENGSYMIETVNTLVAEKERNLQRLQENLDKFDAEAFMADKDFDECFGSTGYKESEDILDTPIYEDDECYTEMATVARDEKRQMRIQVNPDRKRIGNPYFKVFNTVTPKEGKSKVVRFHFNDENMEYHKDGYLDWVVNKSEIKLIKTFLMESHEDFSQYTNWQMACYLWNYEYGLISNPEKYFKGEDDEKNKDHPSYVKHDQEIPETWVYNPLMKREASEKKNEN